MESIPPPLISVISPVYGCAACLRDLHRRVTQALSAITSNFELILVNDHSRDGAWEVIGELCATDSRVIGIDLSRNFGQHIAIAAGLDRCRGEWVVVMDCDLQDRPEEIPRLFKAVQQGYDFALARRMHRQDSFFRKAASKSFYALLSYLTDTQQDPSVANFGIYHRKVIDAVISIRESHHYFPVTVRSVGFRMTSIEVDHAAREVGKSSYNLRKMLRLAVDNAITYSDKPLRLTVGLGFFLVALTLLAAALVVTLSLVGKIDVAGWTSIVFSLFFLSGLIIMLIGMVGLYVGKTFIEAKKRPAYFIRETYDATTRH
jgi:dolichol-phosphate mannosyltransferase